MEIKKKNKKNKKREENRLLIIKINGENIVFNCSNVKQNSDAINKMVKDKYLSIFSIFIKTNNNIKNEKEENKSYFYYYKQNKGLVENELTQEIFEKYLHHLLTNSNSNLNVVNLYIINGNTNSSKQYNYNSIKKLLGFEPNIKFDGNLQKILFFIQYLNEAQILYHLYKEVYNQESLNTILLINYTKYGGYQIILFQNDEIINNLKEFKLLNKNNSNDKNMKIISNGIKKLKEDKEEIIDIILTVSIDDKESEITPGKMEEKIMENIGENENDKNNIRIIKTDKEFNIHLQLNSHIFYLDN